jgi:hypothetical protein
MIVAADCTATSEELHEPALACMAYLFPSVMTWRAALEALLAEE